MLRAAGTVDIKQCVLRPISLATQGVYKGDSPGHSAAQRSWQGLELGLRERRDSVKAQLRDCDEKLACSIHPQMPQTLNLYLRTMGIQPVKVPANYGKINVYT